MIKLDFSSFLVGILCYFIINFLLQSITGNNILEIISLALHQIL